MASCNGSFTGDAAAEIPLLQQQATEAAKETEEERLRSYWGVLRKQRETMAQVLEQQM